MCVWGKGWRVSCNSKVSPLNRVSDCTVLGAGQREWLVREWL